MNGDSFANPFWVFEIEPDLEMMCDPIVFIKYITHNFSLNENSLSLHVYNKYVFFLYPYILNISYSTTRNKFIILRITELFPLNATQLVCWACCSCKFFIWTPIEHWFWRADLKKMVMLGDVLHVHRAHHIILMSSIIDENEQIQKKSRWRFLNFYSFEYLTRLYSFSGKSLWCFKIETKISVGFTFGLLFKNKILLFPMQLRNEVRYRLCNSHASKFLFRYSFSYLNSSFPWHWPNLKKKNNLQELRKRFVSKNAFGCMGTLN